MHWFLGVLGVLIVLSAAMSLVRTLIVPRALRSRLARVALAAVRLPLQGVADLLRTYELRDRVLAYAAPVSILATLVVWLGAFLLGYALLLEATSALGFVAAVREAGSSMLTLGFASSDRGRLTALDFCAAVTGPIAIGTLVGYLPALYGAYARRETEVTLLSARAGYPAWGPEILARHAQVDLLDELNDLYRGWERWCADIAESHTSYPALVHFRSPQAHRNWLVGLLAVMDSAALHLALNPSGIQRPGRLMVRAGFVCLRSIADVEQITYDADPSPDAPISLSYEDYLTGIARLAERGYPMERSPREAWPDFRGWRINYEAMAYAMAWRIEAVPAPWSGPRRSKHQTINVESPIDRRPTRV